MSDDTLIEHPAAAEQPAPHGEGVDVILDLVEKIKTDRWEWPNEMTQDRYAAVREVCNDLGWSLPEALLARRELGIFLYGTPLTTNNGRNARIDMAQELLDALIYAWQFKLEQEVQ